MRKLVFLLGLLLLSIAPAQSTPPPDERVERIKAQLRVANLFLQGTPVVSKLQVVDFLGFPASSVNCAPSGQARGFYDTTSHTWRVIDSTCTDIIAGAGAAVKWNNLLNPNGDLSPDFGGSHFTFSNGIWDWGTMDLRLPHVSGSDPAAEGSIGYDSGVGNLYFFSDVKGILGQFDANGPFTDGDLVAVSLSGSRVKLVDMPLNQPGDGTTIWNITTSNLRLGDTSCVTDLGPPLVISNCTPGVPVSVQTGTTYTYDGVNDRGSAIFANNAGIQTYSLAQIADAGDFDANWFVFQGVLQGILNINATTSTFASTGTTSETLLPGQNCSFFTDTTGNGSIYTKCSESRIAAGPGINLQRSAQLLTISSTAASANVNQLISGGGVSWTSGLTFEVSAATYQIGGVTYTSTEGATTLGAADPTNPRIDVIAVNSSGAVVVIAGTPAPSPLQPTVDPTSQLALTFVTVNAAASTPVVGTSILYQNNAGSPTEYNCTSSANINCNSTNNPFGSFTHSIEGTSVVQGNNATLTVGTGQVNLNTFDILVFYIRNKAAWPNATSLQIFWRNGSVNVGTAITFKANVYGFNQGNTTTYQQIVIPVSAFQTGNTPITNLRFQMLGSGTIGFYLGNVQLQSGFSGGGGSGGGTGFQLQVNEAPTLSTASLHDSASVTFAQSTVAGITQVTATAIGAPPSGAAGGDLSGTFPNPTVVKVNGGSVPANANVVGTDGSSRIVAATAGNSSAIEYVAGGGTAQAQTATLSPAVTAQAAGLRLCWLPAAANTGAAPTIAVNGLTAKPIVKVGGAALVANDLTTTAIACAIYDGTSYELQNPQTNVSGYSQVQSGGTNVTQRSTLNFLGSAVSCADDSGNTRTDCTFANVNGPPSPAVQYISGTSYTVANSDNSWRTVFTASGATAVTLPQANTISAAPFVALRYSNNIASCTTCTSGTFAMTGGDTLVVEVSWSSSTITLSSLTLSNGDVGVRAFADKNNIGNENQNESVWIFYNVTAAGSVSLTATMSSATQVGIDALEYVATATDHAAINSAGASSPYPSVTIPVSYSSAVAIAPTFMDFGLSPCPTGWTGRVVSRVVANFGNVTICEKLLSSVASITFPGGTVNKNASIAGLLDLAISATPQFTSGWFTVLVNESGNLVTVTPTTSNIRVDGTARTSLTIPRGRWCALMSDGTDYDAICGGETLNHTTPIHQTGKTAAISTATLCASSPGACIDAGQYHVHWDFIETGTACATPGPGGVTFLLTWTDSNAVAHSAVSLPMHDSASLTATSGTFTFQTSNANAWASGDFNISTNGTQIQYATGYTACTSGTGTYQLDAIVTKLQY